MSDEDACAICLAVTSKTSDQIVYCDGKNCNIPVHQSCYKIPEIPEGDWFCQRCLDKRKGKPVDIICCAEKGGALKRTKVPGEFAHVVCTWFNRKVMDAKEPYEIEASLKNANVCTLCKSEQGITINCYHSGCKKHFHATCGINHGIIEPTFPLPTFFRLYCPTHKEKDLLGKRPFSYGSAVSDEPKKTVSQRLPSGPLIDSSASSLRQSGPTPSKQSGTEYRVAMVSGSNASTSSRPKTTETSGSLSKKTFVPPAQTPSHSGVKRKERSPSLSAPSSDSAMKAKSSGPTRTQRHQPNPQQPTPIPQPTPTPTPAPASTATTVPTAPVQQQTPIAKPAIQQPSSALQFALEAECQYLRSRLEHYENSSAADHLREAQQHAEFKQKVADIFAAMGFPLPDGTEAQIDNIDTYVTRLAEIVARVGGPRETEKKHINDTINQLISRRAGPSNEHRSPPLFMQNHPQQQQHARPQENPTGRPAPVTGNTSQQQRVPLKLEGHGLQLPRSMQPETYPTRPSSHAVSKQHKGTPPYHQRPNRP